MGSGRTQIDPRRLAAPAIRHRPLHQTARRRLAGIGRRRGSIRPRSDGRPGRGRTDPRCPAPRPGAGGAFGRSGPAKIRRHAAGQDVAAKPGRISRRSLHAAAGGHPGGIASLPADGIRFPLPSQPPPVGRNSGRRHGPGKNAANAGLAGLDARQHRAAKTRAGHLPGLRAAQLAARSQPLHPRPQSAGAGKRRRPATTCANKFPPST